MNKFLKSALACTVGAVLTVTVTACASDGDAATVHDTTTVTAQVTQAKAVPTTVPKTVPVTKTITATTTSTYTVPSVPKNCSSAFTAAEKMLKEWTQFADLMNQAAKDFILNDFDNGKILVDQASEVVNNMTYVDIPAYAGFKAYCLNGG